MIGLYNVDHLARSLKEFVREAVLHHRLQVVNAGLRRFGRASGMLLGPGAILLLLLLLRLRLLLLWLLLLLLWLLLLLRRLLLLLGILLLRVLVVLRSRGLEIVLHRRTRTLKKLQRLIH